MELSPFFWKYLKLHLSRISKVPHLPRADLHPEGRRAGDAAVVPGQPAARPDGPPEEGGHPKVLHASDPGEREIFASLHRGFEFKRHSMNFTISQPSSGELLLAECFQILQNSSSVRTHELILND